MSSFFEIAYAAASKRLCLFTGTGFSKAITDNAAPTWQGLLELMCDELPDPAAMKGVLFPKGGKNPLSLEESAQVIDIELAQHGKNIHDEISKKLKTIKLSGDNTVISEFFQKYPLRIATTNFDKLAEKLANETACHSIAPGYPVPRSPANVKVYHVHGSIDSPKNMVVTSDDYFKFINGHSYFSRKLSTVLHENTVVILGYSLGDTNLKAILSDYRGFSRTHGIGGNIFLVSRSEVAQHVKDYYAHCYGIRVLDEINVHEFFQLLNNEMPNAVKCATSSIENINIVLKGGSFTEEYLKVEMSFFEIIASVAAIGKGINDPAIVAVLEKVIKKKIELTGQNGAWEQYEHLARWLVYLGSILELSRTSVEETFLDAVLRSMNKMSYKLTFGYSWHAHTSWSLGWSRIIPANRAIIRAYIEAKSVHDDALAMVRRP